MTISKLDKIYRSILLSKYFIKGWGSADNLKRLLQIRKIFSNRETCYNLVGDPYPVEITKEKVYGKIRIIEGFFHSPFDLYLPSLLPKKSKNAYFQIVLPNNWKQDGYKPVCLHFAGTGDHNYWRRRYFMANPLLKEAGIGAILLENPFYGARKPEDQVRSVLHNVSDIFVMGGCLILEGIVLLQWCKRQGFGPLGVSGFSMGGHMASLVATNWPFPLVLVPCLSSTTASIVFTEGVMSEAINWDMLESQYKADETYMQEIQNMIQIRKSDAFQAGRLFVKNFPDSMMQLNARESDVHRNLYTNDKLSPKHDRSNATLTHEEYNSSSATKSIQDKIVDILKSSETLIKGNSPFKKTLQKVLSSSSQQKMREYEALNFMRGIMDECTHLKNFSVPVDPSLIINVCAKDDAYVPSHGVSGIADIWPGAEVRYIKAGHVLGFILHQKEFRQAIIDAFRRYSEKYG